MADEGADPKTEPEDSEGDAPQTAGQRLAAAKAAKAAKKAAERGRQAELTEQRALEQAAAARDWMQENITKLLAISAVVVVAAAALFTWGAMKTRRYSTAGALLAEATKIARAEVNDSPGEGEFATVATRAQAADAKLQQVVSEAPGSLTAAWAQLARARLLVEQGQVAEAREAYEAALGVDDETVSWLALEGLAYTYEAEGALDQALEKLEALRGLGKTTAPIAQYHQGRLLMAQDKRDQAKETLQAVLTALQEPGAPSLPHTKAQVEARLAVLEPGRPKAPAFDQNQLQQLLQMQNPTP